MFLLIIILFFYIKSHRLLNTFKLDIEFFSNLNEKKNIYFISDNSGLGNQIRGFAIIELINNIFDNNTFIYCNDLRIFKNFDIKNNIIYAKDYPKHNIIDISSTLKNKNVNNLNNLLKNSKDFLYNKGHCENYKKLIEIDSNFYKKYRDIEHFQRKLIKNYFSEPNKQMIHILNKVPHFNLGVRYRHFEDVPTYINKELFEENLQKYINHINKNIKKENELIFVTSDNKKFIEHLIKKFNVFTLDFKLSKYSDILENKNQHWHSSKSDNNTYSNSMLSWFILKDKIDTLISLTPTTFCQTAYMGSNIKNYITDNKSKHFI